MQDVTFYNPLYDTQMSLSQIEIISEIEERELKILALQTQHRDLADASAHHRSDTLGAVRKFNEIEDELDVLTDHMNPDGAVFAELHKMRLGLSSFSMSDLAKIYDENFIKLQVMYFEQQFGIK